MKYSILILLTISFASLANYEQCKQSGELAKEIMIKRQSQEDVFKLLPLYKGNEEIVLEAYEVERFDIISQLSKAVNARSSIIKADELRKYDEIKNNMVTATNKFKLKYIKKCLQQ